MRASRKFLVFDVKALHVNKKDFENNVCLVVGFIERIFANMKQQQIVNKLM